MLFATTYAPYPNWLVPGDNTWQLVSATLVGLMSIPALAVLYAGLVQKKWIVNTIFMVFSGFALTLLVWMCWGFSFAFGTPQAHFGSTGSFWSGFIGDWFTLFRASAEQGRAASGALLTGLQFHYPTATFAYFQFVFAAITPLLFLGGLLGRLKFKAWLLIVPLWITFVYCINAALLWGGGFFAQKGAVDYSGGYVIHLSAGVASFTAAAIVGPRLKRDRTTVPSNLTMVAIGAGLLWMGWNGFNGGDPFYAGADAAAAVLNTNVATAVGVLTWMGMDMLFSRQKKPTFLGAINGMLCGLVAITPSAGWVDGFGAICVGFIASFLVWFAWNYLSRIKPFNKVDDALGVVYTHGFAGLIGGLLVGLLADPSMIMYGAPGKNFQKSGNTFSVGGLFYGAGWHQLWEQFLAAVWIIGFTAAGTAVVFYLVRFLVRGLREPDAVLEIGDLAIHDEEAFPTETFAERINSMSR